MDCKMGKSSSSEDYLKCILVLQKKNDLVRSIDIAENIYSKNSLLSRLLELMGVSKDTAEKEACLMEHTISDETYERMDEFVNAHEENWKM